MVAPVALQRPDAAGAAMDQKQFAIPEGCSKEDIASDGEGGFRQARSVDRINAFWKG